MVVERLARTLVHRGVSLSVVVVTLSVAFLFAWFALSVEQDDDLLAFLPQDNTDVGTFYEVNKRFGGLDLALVGVETTDVFAPAFVRDLQDVTRDLDALPGLAHVLSITNVEDFAPDPVAGGIVTGLLVDGVPASPEESAALRKKVLSRTHAVGSLVSADGKAVMIYCSMAEGAEPREMTAKIREVVGEGLGDARIYEGGSPFISTYIYDTTQADMGRLTPWAVAVIVFILLLAFRDVVGSLLILVSTGAAIAVAIGTMNLVGESFNIVLWGMPVILFAVGSAYSIHVLSRYYGAVGDRPVADVMVETLVSVGPTVVAAGLTTVAGLLSFMLMDIRPLRIFGAYTALGILGALILALTFVPATVILFGLRGRGTRASGQRNLLGRFAAGVQRQRGRVLILVLGVTIGSAYFVGSVDSRMDPRSFYEPGSPPDASDQFMVRAFGGSQFLQVAVSADLREPHILRELRDLGDELTMLPHITQVVHVGQAIERVNDSMEGVGRIPDTREKVGVLFGLITGQPSVSQLVTDDRNEGLLVARLDTQDPEEVETTLASVEAILAERGRHGYVLESIDGARSAEVRRRLQALVASHILALDHAGGAPGAGLNRAEIEQALDGLVSSVSSVSPEALMTPVMRFLRSDESLVELPEATDDGDPARAVATAVLALGADPTSDQLEKAIKSVMTAETTDESYAEDMAFGLATPLREMWSRERSMSAAKSLLDGLGVGTSDGPEAKAYLRAVADTLVDLEAPSALLTADGPSSVSLAYTLTGMPLLNRGLSRSVTSNQWRSLFFALVVVLVIMVLLFGSVTAGLLACVPTVLTLLVVYGGMGLLDIHLDIGTSMLASLIIGAGVDYGVHLLSAWHVPPGCTLADGSARTVTLTGPAIVTNALTVAAGFFVLTLGDARPLQNVGGLTAIAMATAAMATFVAIPALARRASYGRSPDPVDLALGEVDAVDEIPTPTVP